MWLQQSGVPKSVVAVGSSSAHPLLVGSDDLPETAPATGGQKRRNLSPTHADEEERLPLKRKLDFSQEYDFYEPITLDNFGHVLTGEKDHGLGDLFNLSVEDYTIGECGISRPFSSPGVTEAVPHTPSALDFLSTLPGCDQEIRHSQDPEVMVVSGKGAQMDCSFIKDTFMDATDFVVKRALEGLNDSTLGDPEGRTMLESVSQMLPTQVPEVAKLEGGQTEFTKESERDEHVVAEVELKIKSGHEVSKATIEDLSDVEKKCTEMEAREAELKAHLEEVTATLHRLKLEMEQRRQAHDDHQSEQKKLVKSLQDTNAGKRTRLAEFKQKTTDLKTQASQLLNNLQN
ncbi:hypothetical protein VPH35_116576 [Triticum aestivum]